MPAWLGCEIRSIGPPFVLGVGFILAGVVLMFVATGYYKTFFARHRETVETMTETPRATMIDPESARIEPPTAA